MGQSSRRQPAAGSKKHSKERVLYRGIVFLKLSRHILSCVSHELAASYTVIARLVAAGAARARESSDERAKQ